jgi:hypothetical protein
MMRKRIVVGIALLSILMLAGCDKLPSSGSQRFQIVFNPNVRADTFLIDTQKGKVWQVIKYTDLEDQPTVWQPMEIIDPDGDIGVSPKTYFERHPPIKKK